jgi:hypothetical protein
MDQLLPTNPPRIAFLLAQCGAAGVLLNVLLAWTLAILPPPTAPSAMVPTGGNQSPMEVLGRPAARPFHSPKWLWAHPRAARFDGRDAEDFDQEGRGMFEVKRLGMRIHHQTDFWAGEPVQTITQHSYGWPALALERWKTYLIEERSAGGLKLTARVGGRVCFSGLMINAVCYGNVFYVLWTGPAAYRSRIRRRRGQCTHCGYDLPRSGERVCRSWP